MKPTLSLPKALDHLELLPYQSAFAANNSRFKIGLWARQTGKDHTAALEAVLDGLYHPGTNWIILAASERQALESLSKDKDWADILKFRIDECIESPANLPFDDGSDSPCGEHPCGEHLRRFPDSSYRATEIRWSNGSRLFALPANPQTIRGYSANVILTEFAFHENPDVIWRAIYPSISNPLRGGVKKLRIISTPNGLTNKFSDLWLNTSTLSETLSESWSESLPSLSDPTLSGGARSPSAPSLDNPPLSLLTPVQESAIYFKSKVTIHDAIASGLPLNAAELSGKIELCQFTTVLKAELFPRLRAALEQRLLRIRSSREIREDPTPSSAPSPNLARSAIALPTAPTATAPTATATAPPPSLSLSEPQPSAPASQGATVVRPLPGRGRGLVWNRRGPSTPYRRRYCL